MSNASSIDHVIMVVFENRSFDHLLGWMSHPKYGGSGAIEGLTGDLDAGTGELANPAYGNPALLKTFRPFFAEADETLATDLPHGRGEVHTQMAFTQVTNTFSMQGFAASYFHQNPMQAGPSATRPDCMRMLAPSAAPVTAFLARNYCVCDHWFTPIPTDTHPNRMMALAGYSEIEGTSSLEPDEDLVFDWAERKGIPWRVYSDDFSYMMCLGRRGVDVLAQRAINGSYRSFSSFARDYQFETKFPAITLIEPAFSDDPFATEPNDNHPPLQMGPGESFLLKIYNVFFGTRLARERFAKTLLLVYYDEHGGFFDHVSPLAVATPSGRTGSKAKWPTFTTTGPRVPAIAVSPLIDPGVFKGNLDHTSVLRFLGERFARDGLYSAEVTARHATPGAELRSAGDVVNRATPRAVPSPPNFGGFASVSFPSGRAAITDGQLAFLHARMAAQQDSTADLAQAHPDHFFGVTASPL
jgi:phospholipase C